MMGVLRTAVCHASATHEVLWASPACSLPEEKQVASKSPVGDISVVTPIRTDTSLGHSQKAEKECFMYRASQIIGIAVVKHMAFIIIVNHVQKQN